MSKSAMHVPCLAGTQWGRWAAEFRQTLSDQGIGTEIYYPIPLHLQECFRDLGCKEGDFPIAEECAKTSMALPIFGDLTEEELREVAGDIRTFFASNSTAR